jgi:ABC-type multidrug transport system ATPase subunit
VRELRAADRVILVASHNLDELQRVADRVAILDRGQLRRVVDVRAAADGGAGAYRLVVQSGLDAALAAFPGARALGEGELEVRTHGLPALNAALARAIADGAVFAAVAPAGTPLEAAFRESVAEAQAP